ncbi:GNAT family N-acetyltransferase [Streptomyces sp. SP18CS02]|uniref:GNAT family N-acetyltransferase n=1 Tax=Streptomyces sp. SP18CS02 TaxID=3002531 RepID=UPI002E79979E|nr:GNAT family N-acetyltransferase [Streptomyces sp. SP18CS02]
MPLRAGHADEMAVVLGDPALHTFIGGAPADVVGLRARYERMLAGPGPEQPGVAWCNWVVRLRAEDRLTGTLQATVTEGGGAEIAWVTGTPWQGRGIASEGARALVEHLRARGVGPVIAHVHPEHGASAAVARAVGLSPTGVLHDGEVRWQLGAGPGTD